MAKQCSMLPTVTSLTPTCMRLESMGAVVLTMWTLGVDVERMRCSGGLAGAGKEKCSWSRCWVKGLGPWGVSSSFTERFEGTSCCLEPPDKSWMLW